MFPAVLVYRAGLDLQLLLVILLYDMRYKDKVAFFVFALFPYTI